MSGAILVSVRPSGPTWGAARILAVNDSGTAPSVLASCIRNAAFHAPAEGVAVVIRMPEAPRG